MKISIITVAYNAADHIRSAIDAVLGQTYPDIEYIIVDGVSTDGTVDVVKSYGDRIAKFVSEPDKGIYDAMNKGIALATGDVVGILNADDFYTDDRVLERVADCLSGTDVDACFSDLVYVDANNTDKVIRYWKSCPYQDGLFEKGWMPAHPTFFMKRWCYEKYGKFDLSIPIGTDFDLLFRMIHAHRIRTRYIPEILVKMRTGGESNKSIQNIVRQNMTVIRTLKKHGVPVSPMFFIAKFSERLGQFVTPFKSQKI